MPTAAPIIALPFPPLASSGDVQVRLGRTLTDEEATQADFLCELGTVSIMMSLGVGPSFAIPSGAQAMLGLLTVELVNRVMSNPNTLAQHSETLGSYSYSEVFASRGDIGLTLTPAEELMARRLVFGSTTASVKVRSMADDYADNFWPWLDPLIEADTGDTSGTPGLPSAPGTQWFAGSGDPANITDAVAGDFYIDENDGSVWQYTAEDTP